LAFQLAVLALVIGVLILIGLAVIVLYVGFRISKPVRTRIEALPDLDGLRPIELTPSSGARLAGWYAPGRPGGGGVVLMHGVWGNRLKMVRRAETLNALGCAVLLFDFQAHGESGGSRITFGQREALDAEAAIAFLRRQAPGERIGAIAVSMGAAAALVGDTALPVDALVLESVYPTIDAALGNRIKAMLAPRLGAVLTPILMLLSKALLPPILGVSRAALRPIDRIERVTAPLLVASGMIDDRTTLDEAQALYDRATARKRFWAVPHAGHVDLEAVAPDAYRKIVIAFLVEELQRHPLGALGVAAQGGRQTA
jgi:fermentation-respiration switch protein FrsA (DUF1100 family)